MINIEELGKRAINKLKSDFDLPKKGLLAGGSIANLIWEYVTGNKAVINDVDIFILDGNSRLEKSKRLYEFEKKESVYYDDSYGGINYRNKVNEYYEISDSIISDKINEIYYVSNTNDPNIIIESFDLNCVQVGYSIEEDKFYWTRDFEKFLKNGELKIVNLLTPGHTLLRMVKKSFELKSNYNKFEIDLLKHVLDNNLQGVIRTTFKSRYKEIFDKYKNILSRDFRIFKDQGKSEYIKNKYNDDSCIWQIKTKGTRPDFDFIQSRTNIFNDKNLDKIYSCQEFIFYMRNIYGDKYKTEFWKELRFLFIDDYLDIIPNEKDINLLIRMIKYAPKTINTLRGLKISEQIKRIKFILEEFKHDPIIGISILEKHKDINTEKKIDDSMKLILELTVRKNIINDANGKVSKILNS
jgi:hypothetical protein